MFGTNYSRGFLGRALLATLEGISPEEFAERELSRMQDPVEASFPPEPVKPSPFFPGWNWDKYGRLRKEDE